MEAPLHGLPAPIDLKDIFLAKKELYLERRPIASQGREEKTCITRRCQLLKECAVSSVFDLAACVTAIASRPDTQVAVARSIYAFLHPLPGTRGNKDAEQG